MNDFSERDFMIIYFYFVKVKRKFDKIFKKRNKNPKERNLRE